MEKTEIKVANNVKKDAIQNYALFKWNLVEEQEDLKETKLVFERDDSLPYYKKLVALENKFNNVYTIPGWFGYGFIFMILGYVTTLTILWLTHVLDVEKGVFVLILAIPTGVMLLLNVLLTYLRSKQMRDHIEKKELKYQKYQKLVDKLENQQ